MRYELVTVPQLLRGTNQTSFHAQLFLRCRSNAVLVFRHNHSLGVDIPPLAVHNSKPHIIGQ